jgi:hypothetical protein
MLFRLRAELKESTAGSWLDAELYSFITSGRNAVIQVGLAKESIANAEGVDYKSPVLQPLVTLDALNTTTIGGTLQEYNLPAAFIKTYSAEYSNTNGGIKYPCAVKDFNLAYKRSRNSFANNNTSPIAYTKAEKLGFFPQPLGAGAGNYAHYCYTQPADITGSGADLILREETHEAILERAIAYALVEDGDENGAQIHLQNFVKIIEGLC